MKLEYNPERKYHRCVDQIERFMDFALCYGEDPNDYWVLAAHAAFPFTLTPDFLYCLREYLNHQGYRLPWIAVADLLSYLCEEIDHNLYQMEGYLRDCLLRELLSFFGEEKLQELSDLMMGYMLQRFPQDSNVYQNLALEPSWIALSYLAPNQHIETIAKTFKQILAKQDYLELCHLVEVSEKFIHTYLQQEYMFLSMLDLMRGYQALYEDEVETAKEYFSRVKQPGEEIAITSEVFIIPLGENLQQLYVEQQILTLFVELDSSSIVYYSQIIFKQIKFIILENLEQGLKVAEQVLKVKQEKEKIQKQNKSNLKTYHKLIKDIVKNKDLNKLDNFLIELRKDFSTILWFQEDELLKLVALKKICYQEQQKLYQPENSLQSVAKNLKNSLATMPKNSEKAAKLGELGLIERELGKLDQAYETLNQSLEILVFMEQQYSLEYGATLLEIANLEWEFDNLTEAESKLNQAQEIIAQTQGKNNHLYAKAFYLLALIAREQNNPEIMIEYINEAVKLIHQLRSPSTESRFFETTKVRYLALKNQIILYLIATINLTQPQWNHLQAIEILAEFYPEGIFEAIDFLCIVIETTKDRWFGLKALEILQKQEAKHCLKAVKPLNRTIAKSKDQWFSLKALEVLLQINPDHSSEAINYLSKIVEKPGNQMIALQAIELLVKVAPQKNQEAMVALNKIRANPLTPEASQKASAMWQQINISGS